MGTAVMMYVLPMLLGQTYDLGKEKPGLQIFPTTVERDAVTLNNYATESQYRMVENSADVKDFLDISGKLSLKIKAGLVDVHGEGSYLKKSSSKKNGIEILVKVHFQTVTKTIPSSVKPNADWSLLNEKYLGTHYVRSITYGGDLIASVRLSASNTFDLMRIKGAINGGINAKAFKANVKGKLDILKQNAQDSSSLEISYYASVPLHGVSYDVDGLMKLIEDFPSHVKKVNNGIGNPLRMELYPISSLRAGWQAYFENRALTDELDDLENQFDDLRETRGKIGVWVTSLPPVIPEEADEEIQKFTDKVNKIFGVYLKTIGDLDLSKNASTQPIKDAFNAYEDSDYIMPQKYSRKLATLQKDIYKKHPELKPRVGGALFTRWGRSECPSECDAIVVGVMTTSEVVQNGGSSEFVCSPLDPDQVDPAEYFKGYPGNDNLERHIFVGPLMYVGEASRFASLNMKHVACAVCRAGTRTAVLVKPADTKCPSSHWTKEYEGVLMAGAQRGVGQKRTKGEFVCVDNGMEQPKGEVKFGNSDAFHLPEMEEVSVECGSLPCDKYKPGKTTPCVVCTI